MRPSKLKTTLAVLRNALKTVEEILASQKDRKTGALEKVPRKIKVVVLTKEQVSKWLECSVSKIEHLENRDLQLSSEDAGIIAWQTGVNFQWLMDNDVSKPITNKKNKPYSPADYEKRQGELKKRNFTHPDSNNDLRRVRNALAENFAKVAAISIRALEIGQFEVYDFKLRKVLREIYEESGGTTHEWNEFIIKAVYHGHATLTRPDITVLLDEWETCFMKIISKKTSGKLPVIYPRK